MTNRRSFNSFILGGSAGVLLASCSSLNTDNTVKAIDCHTHIFHRGLAMPDLRRAPAGYDATLSDYLGQLNANSMSHGVLVQPSFLGYDNSYLVEALRQHPTRLRGIAVVHPTVREDELDALQQAGVVGIRLNQVGLPAPDFSSPPWRALLKQLAQRQWQVEVHQLAQELQPLMAPLLDAGIPVVVDHFGRPDATLGVDDPGFQYLLSLGATKRVWVKLSGAYRNGGHGRGEATAIAATPLLKTAYGLDRLVWGSDWPHTLFEKTASFSTERMLLNDWLPDASERQIVLQTTPAKLFRL